MIIFGITEWLVLEEWRLTFSVESLVLDFLIYSFCSAGQNRKGTCIVDIVTLHTCATIGFIKRVLSAQTLHYSLTGISVCSCRGSCREVSMRRNGMRTI